MDIPKGDVVWLMVVMVAALGFVELSRHQEPQAYLFATTVAWVTVATALLWVVLGQEYFHMAEQQEIRLADLQPHSRNYNQHSDAQIARIAKSLSTFGQVRSIVTWHNTILAGHGVVLAARSLGWETIRADVQDHLTSEQALAYVVADNELARQSDPDQAQLAAILEELQAKEPLLVEAAGYSAQELEQLLRSVNPKPPVDAEPQVDRAEELRVKWDVHSGDLWQLGEHRLICGDCTEQATVARVMGGERAALTVTSPPYGVGKEYESGGLEEWEQTVSGMLAGASSICSLMAINLNDVKVGPNQREIHTYGLLIEMCESAGLPLIGTRVWTKQPAWAQGPYWLSSYRAADDFEYIGIFGEAEYKDRTVEDWRYRGTWEITSVTANKLHSAMFPLELPARLIKLLCDEGSIVYDPFAGSGTTGIACHNLGRRARMVEISAAYTAVILERFHAIGVMPELIESAVLETA